MRLGQKGALALVAALVALWMFSGAAGAADGGVECGSVITENTVLTHDLLGCEDGLIVAAPGLTLDLGGHQIVGQGSGTGVSLAFLEAGGSVVRNGAISSFENGLSIVHSATLSRLDVSSNHVGVFLFARATIERSAIHHNGVGVFISCCSGLNPGDAILGNRIVHNQEEGIRATRGELARIERNLVMGNGGDGVSLFETFGIVLDNTFKNNGGAGLKIRDGCFFWQFIYRVGGNTATGNGELGIDVPGGDPEWFSQICLLDPFPVDLDAGGNSARKNGDPRECFGVVCEANQPRPGGRTRTNARRLRARS
jgi:hypothetical protein